MMERPGCWVHEAEWNLPPIASVWRLTSGDNYHDCHQVTKLLKVMNAISRLYDKRYPHVYAMFHRPRFPTMKGDVTNWRTRILQLNQFLNITPFFLFGWLSSVNVDVQNWRHWRFFFCFVNPTTGSFHHFPREWCLLNRFKRSIWMLDIFQKARLQTSWRAVISGKNWNGYISFEKRDIYFERRAIYFENTCKIERLEKHYFSFGYVNIVWNWLVFLI